MRVDFQAGSCGKGVPEAVVTPSFSVGALAQGLTRCRPMQKAPVGAYWELWRSVACRRGMPSKPKHTARTGGRSGGVRSGWTTREGGADGGTWRESVPDR